MPLIRIRRCSCSIGAADPDNQALTLVRLCWSSSCRSPRRCRWVSSVVRSPRRRGSARCRLERQAGAARLAVVRTSGGIPAVAFAVRAAADQAARSAQHQRQPDARPGPPAAHRRGLARSRPGSGAVYLCRRESPTSCARWANRYSGDREAMQTARARRISCVA